MRRETGAPVDVVELGAGTAGKTQTLLRCMLARQTECLYVPVDVSGAAIAAGTARLREAMPLLRVCPLVMTHEEAFDVLAGTTTPQLVLFIGSSVGNMDDCAAATLLAASRRALGEGPGSCSGPISEKIRRSCCRLTTMRAA